MDVALTRGPGVEFLRVGFHLCEVMLTGWGTFLAPAVQRGRLVFRPSEGRNVAAAPARGGPAV